MVAPASMLDGQIQAMRQALDSRGFHNLPIMAYSAKFASKLYDPFFKEGTQSTLSFGDKRTHQMDFSNSDEAMREIAQDIQEGADIIMVKPALSYLDIVYRAKQQFQMPIAVYNVSGEYAMIDAAARLGRLDRDAIMLEALTCMKRAGADIIITYFAKRAAELLNHPERFGAVHSPAPVLPEQEFTTKS
jgi:porphobilinogen synthase